MSYQLRFISPSSAIFDELEQVIAKTCPDECLISIEEIMNTELEERYRARRHYIQDLGDVNEVRVFHGARHFKAISSILSDGFKSGLNTTSAFGRGTYFATSYGYSKSYSSLEKMTTNPYKIILLCDISYHKLVLGRSNQILDPAEGDCWTDSLTRPSIFSVPHDDQCIPRFLVRFF